MATDYYISMTPPSGNAALAMDVDIADVQSYLDLGWTASSLPTYTLEPPNGIQGSYCGGDSGPNSRYYAAIDSNIDPRATATISDPTHYADVEALVAGGWKVTSIT